ncbi:acyltransferase family protein [Phytohalomonas tamaricis]|uniref:acyltransferase family protein n=1 Tax=Phytohalomonas tamaricis TaxID=2081032 RepID=UPI000D0B7037|nr:acyltransferase [Phytohalomonas tamaricis]
MAVEQPVAAANVTAKKERFIGLEWLRFGLGLYIVIFHTLHNYPQVRGWSHYVTDVGFFSTSAFFVLSGFLLTHVYLDANKQLREPAHHFLIKRFSNLYPIHVGSFLLTIIVMTALPWLAITPDDAATSFRFVIYDVNNGMGQADPKVLHHMLDNGELALNLFLNLFMLHAWNPLYLTFNPPSWSISALFFFYLTFPFLAPRLTRLKQQIPWIALVNVIYLIPVLYVIATTDYGMPETGILHRNPIIRLPEFIAGILLCSLYAHRRDAGKRLTWGGALGLIALIAVGIGAATYALPRGHEWYYLMHDGLLLPCQLALIYLCVFIPSPRSAGWRRWAGRLGGASLPMFALHVPLYIIFSRMEMVLSGNPAQCFSDFRGCLDAANGISVAWYPLFLLLTVAFCIVFQEQFVVRLRKWLQATLIKKPYRADHTEKMERAEPRS